MPENDKIARDATSSNDDSSRTPDSEHATALSSKNQVNPADAITVITNSFTWFATYANLDLDSMKAEITEKEAPSLVEAGLEALLDVALGAGAAAAGERLFHAVKKYVGSGEVRHEFVKGLFEEGVKQGAEKGRGALAELAKGPDRDKVAESFIISQKKAVAAAGMANQTNFTEKGQHEIKNSAELASLRSACNAGAMEEAGHRQAEATRDAWVSHLAQRKYGNTKEHGDSTNATNTTNMMNQEMRDKTNGWTPGFVPATAPTLGDAARGRAPGVLEVSAILPSIGLKGMNGDPRVRIAFLNGVNENLRAAYTGKPLSEDNIPRQVNARVDGEMPSFSVNIDERGNAVSVGHKDAAWLRARAVVEDRENEKLDDREKALRGLELLLQALVPSSIQRGMGE